MNRTRLSIAGRVTILLAFILFPILSLLLSPISPVKGDSSVPLGNTNLSTGSEDWNYWQAGDVKGLDAWGDSGTKEFDIIALYEKEDTDLLAFRLDFMDFQTDSISPTNFAIDFKDGGNDTLSTSDTTKAFNISWDVMAIVTGQTFKLVDSSFNDHPEWLVESSIDRQLDYLMFKVARTAFEGWDGQPFLIQAVVASPDGLTILDSTKPFRTDNVTGRAKLVIHYMNITYLGGPYSINWYDGYARIADVRPGERRGMRYLMDASEKYQIPITQADLRLEILPSTEFLNINDRYRLMSAKGLFEPLFTLDYGHWLSNQPQVVDEKAIELTSQARTQMEIPESRVFAPYEGMITPADIETIKEAGFDAIFDYDQFHYVFGWLDDWSNPQTTKEYIEAPRKFHRINGMTFIFDPRVGNFQGFSADERWGEIDWSGFSEFNQFTGTDNGLDIYWRRILQDLAINPDQEQYFAIGTDFQWSSWIFADTADWNFKWIASHPWIEATTFSSLLTRGWTPIDHGTLDLNQNDQLMHYPLENDGYYNAYFPWFYYGGIADGHSPFIPAGVEIESYYDYVPYLRDGELIPSGRIMGDDKTPGSIIYETLSNLKSAPDNNITQLAWYSFLINTEEQAFHDKEALHPDLKGIANFVGQANKVVYAANWVDQNSRGLIPSETKVLEQDLDLDGEMEYVMQNNQVLGIFENDGGRLESAFAYDPQFGAVQLVAPANLYTFNDGGRDYKDGEASYLTFRPNKVDGAFVDDLGEDGKKDYGIYSVEVTPSNLIFTSPDGSVRKTFTLTKDTISAQYQNASTQRMNHLFMLTVNPWGTFKKGWDSDYSQVLSSKAVGMQNISGGLAIVNFGDASLLDSYSFLDSPAPQEMKSRDDENTYPDGHWTCFPCSVIKLNGAGAGSGNGTVSLTLRVVPEAVIEPTIEENRTETSISSPESPEQNKTFSIGLLAGIGAAVLVILITVILVWNQNRKKNRNRK